MNVLYSVSAGFTWKYLFYDRQVVTDLGFAENASSCRRREEAVWQKKKLSRDAWQRLQHVGLVSNVTISQSNWALWDVASQIRSSLLGFWQILDLDIVPGRFHRCSIRRGSGEIRGRVDILSSVPPSSGRHHDPSGFPAGHYIITRRSVPNVTLWSDPPWSQTLLRQVTETSFSPSQHTVPSTWSGTFEIDCIFVFGSNSFSLGVLWALLR